MRYETTGIRSVSFSGVPQKSHDDGADTIDFSFVVRIPAAAAKEPNAAPIIVPIAMSANSGLKDTFSAFPRRFFFLLSFLLPWEARYYR